MIDTNDFLHGLEKAGIQFVTGVPDSLLKNICACITDKYPTNQHIIATNEGSAVALAIGHYLATARPALVYMQNSGLGNAINPLISLADPQVYAIPMLLMIGWRGEILDDGSQINDEPQHNKQGRITLAQLKTLGIPYRILDGGVLGVEGILKELVNDAIQHSGPVAIVVRKNTFSPFKIDSKLQDNQLPTREEAIRAVLESLSDDVPVVSTTGMASREIFELRKSAKKGFHRDFLTVGGMGHASQIATGIALAQPDRRVVCIDGDGATLMHSGAMAISADCNNLIHILINNEAHDSVGGQPTKGNVLNFSEIARNFGYRITMRVSTVEELQRSLAVVITQQSSTLLEVRCKLGSREDLGRPDRTPLQNKAELMEFLGAEL